MADISKELLKDIQLDYEKVHSQWYPVGVVPTNKEHIMFYEGSETMLEAWGEDYPSTLGDFYFDDREFEIEQSVEQQGNGDSRNDVTNVAHGLKYIGPSGVIVKVPEGVKDISSTFIGCDLQQVILPSSVKYAFRAFENCKLTEPVKFESKLESGVGGPMSDHDLEDMFKGCDKYIKEQSIWSAKNPGMDFPSEQKPFEYSDTVKTIIDNPDSYDKGIYECVSKAVKKGLDADSFLVTIGDGSFLYDPWQMKCALYGLETGNDVSLLLKTTEDGESVYNETNRLDIDSVLYGSDVSYETLSSYLKFDSSDNLVYNDWQFNLICKGLCNGVDVSKFAAVHPFDDTPVYDYYQMCAISDYLEKKTGYTKRMSLTGHGEFNDWGMYPVTIEKASYRYGITSDEYGVISEAVSNGTDLRESLTSVLSSRKGKQAKLDAKDLANWIECEKEYFEKNPPQPVKKPKSAESKGSKYDYIRGIHIKNLKVLCDENGNDVLDENGDEVYLVILSVPKSVSESGFVVFEHAGEFLADSDVWFTKRCEKGESIDVSLIKDKKKQLVSMSASDLNAYHRQAQNEYSKNKKNKVAEKNSKDIDKQDKKQSKKEESRSNSKKPENSKVKGNLPRKKDKQSGNTGQRGSEFGNTIGSMVKLDQIKDSLQK